jgi:apolipoprotein D and lipocalin family protein
MTDITGSGFVGISTLPYLTVVLWLSAVLARNVGIPDGLEAVKGFAVDRFLGTWYEIARLDHRFERGLINIRAEYSLRDDGGITVINMGFDPRKNAWKKATGKAYFVGDPTVGRLKVSFFGPFYGGYNILELDRDYSYALVCGPSRKYFWILARKPKMEEAVKSALVDKAGKLGFDTDRLIFVEHQE